MSTEAKFLIATVLITTAVLVGGAVYFTQSGSSVASESVDMSQALHTDSHKKGSPEAKVKIAEYSDFQCPACAAAATTIKQLLNEYGDKVYFEYHHFPLANHQHSQIAAEAAEAASAQGKFFEYHDLLFSKQQEWSALGDPVPKFKQYAKDLGLDESKFSQSLDNREFKNKVTDSYTRGVRLQVQATPTFFVNGTRIEGGMSFDDWKKTIDSELAK